MVTIPETVKVFGQEVSTPVLVAAAGMLFVIIVGCICLKCCKSKTAPSSEKFKWPSSTRYIRKTNPSAPPPLVVNKYEDPMRTDELPEDAESHWTVVYQPNGDREEVEQQMYLRFKEGQIFGLGFEVSRRLCKISGKYKYNRTSNQSVLAMTCNFANELDTVLFLGCGNGTGFTGNCFISEMDRFSMLAGIPRLRNITADKFKASFLLMKMNSMGEPDLRAKLHTRRVHKWAGKLYPDESVPMPGSPMHSPGGRRTKSGRDAYQAVDDDSTRGSTTPTRRNRSSEAGRRRRRKGILKYLPFGKKRRKASFESGQDFTSGSSTPSGYTGRQGEMPPWVQPGARGFDDDDDHGGPSLPRGRLEMSPVAGRGHGRRPSGKRPSLEVLNYLDLDGVPGRSGPSMV